MCILQISNNGYVTVGSTVLADSNIDVSGIRQAGNPVVSALWSNYDGNSSDIYYQLHNDTKTMMDTAQFLPKNASNFMPRHVLKVTWAAMRVNPSGQVAAESGLEDFGVSLEVAAGLPCDGLFVSYWSLHIICYGLQAVDLQYKAYIIIAILFSCVSVETLHTCRVSLLDQRA